MNRRGFLRSLFSGLSGLTLAVISLPWALARCGSNPFTYNLVSTTEQNHKHNVSVPCAQIDSPTSAGVTLTSSEVQVHTHEVTFTEAQMLQVKAGTEVTVTSTSVLGHTHDFTLPRTC